MLGLILGSTLALAGELGVGLSGVAVQKSSGWYAWRPTVDVWWGLQPGESLTVRAVLQAGPPIPLSGDGWSYLQFWEQVAATVGWCAGSKEVIFVEIGPALTWMAATWTEPATITVQEFRVGARAAAGLKFGAEQQWVAGLQASSRETTLDFGFGVGWRRLP